MAVLHQLQVNFTLDLSAVLHKQCFYRHCTPQRRGRPESLLDCGADSARTHHQCAHHYRAVQLVWHHTTGRHRGLDPTVLPLSMCLPASGGYQSTPCPGITNASLPASLRLPLSLSAGRTRHLAGAVFSMWQLGS